MTNYQKDAYLRRYGDYEREAARTRREMAFWQERADQVAELAGRRDAAARTERFVRRLLAKYDVCLSERERMEASIETVPCLRERLLLRLHYVDGLTLEAAAEEMDFSTRHVMRIHKKALGGLILFGQEGGAGQADAA